MFDWNFNQKYGWKMQFHCPNLLIFISSNISFTKIKKKDGMKIRFYYLSVWLGGVRQFLYVRFIVGPIGWTLFCVHFIRSFWFWLTEFWRRCHLGSYLIDDSIDDDTKRDQLSVCPLFSHTHTRNPNNLFFLIHKFVPIIHSNPIL